MCYVLMYYGLFKPSVPGYLWDNLASILSVQYTPRLILVLTTLMNCVKCREPGGAEWTSHFLHYCTQSCTPVLSPLSLFPWLVALIAAGSSHSKVKSHIAAIIIMPLVICYHASSLILHTHSLNLFNSI